MDGPITFIQRWIWFTKNNDRVNFVPVKEVEVLFIDSSICHHESFHVESINSVHSPSRVYFLMWALATCMWWTRGCWSRTWLLQWISSVAPYTSLSTIPQVYLLRIFRRDIGSILLFLLSDACTLGCNDQWTCRSSGRHGLIHVYRHEYAGPVLKLPGEDFGARSGKCIPDFDENNKSLEEFLKTTAFIYSSETGCFI